MTNNCTLNCQFVLFAVLTRRGMDIWGGLEDKGEKRDEEDDGGTERK